MRAALMETLGNDLRIGCEDHGEIWPVGLGIELPQERRVEAVKALHDQTGRHVAVGDADGD